MLSPETPSLARLVQEAKARGLGLQIDSYPGSTAGYVKPHVTIRFYTRDNVRLVKVVRTAATVDVAMRRAWKWLQGRRR